MRRIIGAIKKLFFTLIMLVVFLVLALAAAELYMRATSCLGSAGTRNYNLAHPYFGWIGRPNTFVCRSMQTTCAKYRYNRLGFRGPDYATDKPPNTLRIMVLGDSFVEGYQFADEYLMTHHLEDQLRQRTGYNTEVINIGIGGWGTAQQLLAYEHLGQRFNPDIVVLLFSSCNDFINADLTLATLYNERMLNITPFYFLEGEELKLKLPPQQIVQGFNQKIYREGVFIGPAPWQMMHGFKNWLCRLRIGYWLLSRWERLSHLRVLLDELGLYPFTDKLTHTTWGEKGFYHGLSLRFWIYNSEPDEEWRRAQKIENTLILKLAREVQDNGSKFILVSGANIEQVEDQVWELTRRSTPRLRQRQLDLFLPEKTLSLFAKQNSLNYLSLVNYFRAAEQNGQDLFLMGEGHWSKAGQKLAAQVIADFIFNNRLFPDHQPNVEK